jgi:hypothetical protein
MCSDPAAALAQYQIKPEIRAQLLAADLEQIRRFSGFISKVQHNHLWRLFPATRFLLAYYKIELEIFAAFRALQLSPEACNRDRNGRITHFLNFLKDYAQSHRFSGLRETVVHEQNIWELESMADAKGAAATVSNSSPATWRDFLRLIPRPNPTLRIVSFQFDPGKLVESIARGQFRGRLPRHKLHVMAYLKDPRTGGPRVLELNLFSTLFFSHIDGKRSIASVIAASGKQLPKIPRLELAGFFKTCEECGVISLVQQKE